MEDKLIELAKELIAVPSVSGDVEKSVEILEVAKRTLSFDYPFTAFASNGIPSLLFSNRDKNTKEFKVILNAHLDVVPALDIQYKPHVTDGKLYGRGAYDMKAAAAVMIHVFKDIGKDLSYPLALQLTTDEEVGGFNGAKHQLDSGIKTEFFLTGESTSFKIVHETKGRMTVRIETKGRMSHAAYPWQGSNAIWQMYEVFDKVFKKYPVPQHETENTTVNLAKIHTSNGTINKVPDHCEAFLDIRFAPKEKDTIAETIKSLMPENVEFEVLRFTNPHVTKRESPFIQKLHKASEEVLQKELVIGMAHGGSDAAHYAEFADAVEFGPRGYGHHADEEWAETESLANYYKILKNFLLSLE